MSSDTLYLLRRLLSNQHTLTGPEFRAELEKIVGEAYQQEALEPVAWWLEGTDTVEFQKADYHSGFEWTPLYTAPQPAPLSDDVVKDAARYVALRDGSIEHDDILKTVKDPGKWEQPYAVLLRGVALDSAIDAALAAQGGNNHG